MDYGDDDKRTGYRCIAPFSSLLRTATTGSDSAAVLRGKKRMVLLSASAAAAWKGNAGTAPNVLQHHDHLQAK